MWQDVVWPPIRGGEDPDPNAIPQSGPGSPDGAVPDLPEDGVPEPVQTVEIAGESVPLDEIAQWRDAYDNRQSWERSHKQKDQRYAEVRTALEEAFGKPFGEWGDGERASLFTFREIERRMRTDPSYAARVQQAFTQAYRDQGAPAGQAATQARADVKAIQQGTPAAPATVSPEVLRTLASTSADVAAVKQAVVAQELGRLESHVENALDAAVAAHAGSVTEYHDLIEQAVLDRLDQEYDGNDAAMLQAAYEGDLAGRITDLVKAETRRLNTALNRRRVVPGTTGPTTAPPFRGTAATGTGAPEAPTSFAEMHRRAKAALTAP